MPAIPMLARLEAHMSDDALLALLNFLDTLLNDRERPLAAMVSEALFEVRAAARLAYRERHLDACA